MGADRLELVAADPADLDALRGVLEPLAHGEIATDETVGSVSAPVAEPVAALTTAATAIRDKRIEVADLGLRRPTLDAAFLELIGKEDRK
jgi:ABC-2 type transport system ATP-binding protein